MFFINDVTTHLDSPPAYEILVSTGQMNSEHFLRTPEIAARQKELHPEIRPLMLVDSCEVIWPKLKTAVDSQKDWQLVGAIDEKFHLEATATTRFLRFKDDVVIELRSQNPGCEVAMRSKSRLGKGDFGANARRIGEFLTFFKALCGR